MEVTAVFDSERYWSLLDQALREVYGVAESEAAAIVAGLKEEMTFKASEDERLLFFHNEPLAVAEDLTRDPRKPPEPPAEDRLRRYQALAHRFRSTR